MKKAQVTLFVIIAIVIVAGILLFFLVRNNVISIPGITPAMPDVQSIIDKCVRDATSDVINLMLPTGGFISPDNYKLYENNKVQYLCYNSNYYQTCINQQPLYIQHLQSEIKSYITPKVEECFNNLEKDLRKKGFDVSSQNEEVSVVLVPKQADVFIDKNIQISRNDETKNFDKFRVSVNSPIYDLANIAIEIVNQEAKYCYFEYLGFQMTYPNYVIEKKDIDGETKIYTIKEKLSGKQLNIAIRSCAFPAGI